MTYVYILVRSRLRATRRSSPPPREIDRQRDASQPPTSPRASRTRLGRVVRVARRSLSRQLISPHLSPYLPISRWPVGPSPASSPPPASERRSLPPQRHQAVPRAPAVSVRPFGVGGAGRRAGGARGGEEEAGSVGVRRRSSARRGVWTGRAGRGESSARGVEGDSCHRGRLVASRGARGSGEAAERQPRGSREAAERQPRCGRDVGEACREQRRRAELRSVISSYPWHVHDTSETCPRHVRDMSRRRRRSCAVRSPVRRRRRRRRPHSRRSLARETVCAALARAPAPPPRGKAAMLVDDSSALPQARCAASAPSCSSCATSSPPPHRRKRRSRSGSALL